MTEVVMEMLLFNNVYTYFMMIKTIKIIANINMYNLKY